MTPSRTPSAAVAAQFAAERRRRRTLWTSLAVVVVLAVISVAGYQRYSRRPADPIRLPAGTATGDDTGIARGAGPVKIDVFTDFLCPSCKQFEESTADLFDTMIGDGRVTIVAHPVAFLDRMSNDSEYSTRASAASACAADAGRYVDYSRELFRRQPVEHTSGMSDSELIDIGHSLGLDERFADCVQKRTYQGWVAHVTERAVRQQITGTPSVTVNGHAVRADPAEITAAVAAER